eukprot:SAG22_NODE_4_length_44774_cov_362.122149_36_plen_1531_part_00
MEGHHNISLLLPNITVLFDGAGEDDGFNIQMAARVLSPVVLRWQDNTVDFNMLTNVHADEDAHSSVKIVGEHVDHWDAGVSTSFSMQLEWLADHQPIFRSGDYNTFVHLEAPSLNISLLEPTERRNRTRWLPTTCADIREGQYCPNHREAHNFSASSWEHCMQACADNFDCVEGYFWQPDQVCFHFGPAEAAPACESFEPHDECHSQRCVAFAACPRAIQTGVTDIGLSANMSSVVSGRFNHSYVAVVGLWTSEELCPDGYHACGDCNGIELFCDTDDDCWCDASWTTLAAVIAQSDHCGDEERMEAGTCVVAPKLEGESESDTASKLLLELDAPFSYEQNSDFVADAAFDLNGWHLHVDGGPDITVFFTLENLERTPFLLEGRLIENKLEPEPCIPPGCAEDDDGGDGGRRARVVRSCTPSHSDGSNVWYLCDGLRHFIGWPAACYGSHAAGASRQCGLVADIHGATMSAEAQVANTDSHRIANEAGYVILVPSSPGSSWYPPTDHPKIERFMREAVRALQLDTNRVHVMGFSQGGFAAWNLLCRASDLICSIAPLAASGLDSWGAGYGDQCFERGGPTNQRSIFYTSGLLDIPLALHANFKRQVENVDRVFTGRHCCSSQAGWCDSNCGQCAGCMECIGPQALLPWCWPCAACLHCIEPCARYASCADTDHECPARATLAGSLDPVLGWPSPFFVEVLDGENTHFVSYAHSYHTGDFLGGHCFPHQRGDGTCSRGNVVPASIHGQQNMRCCQTAGAEEFGWAEAAIRFFVNHPCEQQRSGTPPAGMSLFATVFAGVWPEPPSWEERSFPTTNSTEPFTTPEEIFSFRLLDTTDSDAGCSADFLFEESVRDTFSVTLNVRVCDTQPTLLEQWSLTGDLGGAERTSNATVMAAENGTAMTIEWSLGIEAEGGNDDTDGNGADSSDRCRDIGNDCCANEAEGEPAQCADGWVPSTQPQSFDGCPNYRCLAPSPPADNSNRTNETVQFETVVHLRVDSLLVEPRAGNSIIPDLLAADIRFNITSIAEQQTTEVVARARHSHSAADWNANLSLQTFKIAPGPQKQHCRDHADCDYDGCTGEEWIDVHCSGADDDDERDCAETDECVCMHRHRESPDFPFNCLAANVPNAASFQPRAEDNDGNFSCPYICGVGQRVFRENTYFDPIMDGNHACGSLADYCATNSDPEHCGSGDCDGLRAWVMLATPCCPWRSTEFEETIVLFSPNTDATWENTDTRSEGGEDCPAAPGPVMTALCENLVVTSPGLELDREQMVKSFRLIMAMDKDSMPTMSEFSPKELADFVLDLNMPDMAIQLNYEGYEGGNATMDWCSAADCSPLFLSGQNDKFAVQFEAETESFATLCSRTLSDSSGELNCDFDRLVAMVNRFISNHTMLGRPICGRDDAWRCDFTEYVTLLSDVPELFSAHDSDRVMLPFAHWLDCTVQANRFRALHCGCHSALAAIDAAGLVLDPVIAEGDEYVRLHPEQESRTSELHREFCACSGVVARHQEPASNNELEAEVARLRSDIESLRAGYC